MLGLLYTFLSFLWYVICEQLKSKKKLPFYLEITLDLITCKELTVKPTKKDETEGNKDELCFKCRTCSKCDMQKILEDNKKAELRRKESHIESLNLCVLLLIALLFFVTYLTIWSIIIS